MEIFIYAVWTTGHRHVIMGSDDGALMMFHRRPIMVYTWVCMLQYVIFIHVEHYCRLGQPYYWTGRIRRPSLLRHLHLFSLAACCVKSLPSPL